MVAGTVHRSALAAGTRAAQYADEACELLLSGKDTNEHGFTSICFKKTNIATINFSDCSGDQARASQGPCLATLGYRMRHIMWQV
jgi:hypothetical protein